MSCDPDLSQRARHAQRLTDSVLADERCLGRIDVLVRSAAMSLGADLASLSMSTDRQITISACSPLDKTDQILGVVRGTETAFEDTVCANALRSDEQLVIPDAHHDARISSIPAVREGHVGAYLGSPMRYDGLIVGMLCVVSTKPRAWTQQEIDTLDRRADEVLTEIICFSSARETV